MHRVDRSLALRVASILWGWEPHETQRQLLLSEARVKVAACGRRWGKTEAAAIDAACYAILHPGSMQMIVSPTYDQSRLIFETVERLLLSSPFTRPLTKVTRTPYPRLTIEGSVIMARTADEDGRNLRGHSADRVIVDEAAYVRDAVIAEVISPMLADRDGQMLMVSTPFGKNHFYRAFIQGSRGLCGHEAFRFPSWANPHISRDYIERQRQQISARQFSVEYEAEFVDSSSCVFGWDDISAAVEIGRSRCLDHPPTPEPDSAVFVGIDWARYSDYTALAAVELKEGGLALTGIERFNGIGWDLQVERACEFLREHRARAALADSTSIGDPILDQLRSRLWRMGANIGVDGVVFTNQSKREVIENLAMLLARRRLALPDHDALIHELQYFEYELTGAGNVRMNARSGHHDDLVIAVGLACRAARGAGSGGGCLALGGRAVAAEW